MYAILIFHLENIFLCNLNFMTASKQIIISIIITDSTYGSVSSYLYIF